MSYTLKNKLLLGRGNNIYNYINSYIDQHKKEKDIKRQIINSEFLQLCKTAEAGGYDDFAEYMNWIDMYSFDEEAVRNLLDEILYKRYGELARHREANRWINKYTHSVCPYLLDLIDGEGQRSQHERVWENGMCYLK